VLAASERGGMRDADRHNRTDVNRRQERRASTGKPDAWKAGKSGLAEGPTEKGRKIPRRRPTLLERGGGSGNAVPLTQPLEKARLHRDLASGLPYLTSGFKGGRALATRPAYLTAGLHAARR